MKRNVLIGIIIMVLLSSSSLGIISHAGDIVTYNTFNFLNDSYYDYFNISGSTYLFNDSGVADVNETILNLTILGVIATGAGMTNVTGNFSVTGDIMATGFYGDGSALTGITASIPSVNITTQHGGEVTGTYDALVLQWLTADWFDNELNQTSSPTFSTITATKYYGMDSVNITSSFGGEVSGTYDAIVLDNNALDDQYFRSKANLTALLDDNYLAEMENVTGNFTISGDMLANAYYGDGSTLTGIVSSVPSVNITTNFGGEVSGTYDAIVLQWLTSAWFDNELNQTSSPTFSAVTTTAIHGVALVNASTSFGGDVTGTYDVIVVTEAHTPSVNMSTQFYGDVTGNYTNTVVHIPSVNISNQNITGNFTVTDNIQTSGFYYGDGSKLANLPAGSTPSVNLTTQFGGEVTGTYDAIVLQWLTADWFDNELNTTSSPTFTAITAGTYNGVPSVNITTNLVGDVTGTYDATVVHTPGVNITTNFGGNVTGTYDAIVLHNPAINITDTFGGDASGTYDALVVPPQNITGNLTVTGDILANAYYGDGSTLTGIISSVPSINLTTQFGGEVSGTYDAIVLQWLTSAWFDNELNQTSSPTFAAVTTTAIHGVALVNTSTNFGGNVSGTYDAIVLHNPAINITDTFGGDATGTYDALVVPMRNITGNFTITGDMLANSYYGDGSTLTGITADWLTSDYFNQNLNTTNDVIFNDVNVTGDFDVGSGAEVLEIYGDASDIHFNASVTDDIIFYINNVEVGRFVS